MRILLVWIICGMVAYLFGSLPFGYLLVKARGMDIRALGSGNIGATNVFRSVSKSLGVLTFALDMLKGVCGAKLVPWGAAQLSGAVEYNTMALALGCGALTIAGHNWTIFLGFKGGKGVAASAGVMVALAPTATGLAILVWLLVFPLTRYVSVASIAAALCLGVVAWPLYMARHGAWFCIALSLLAALAIWRHRANIQRLRQGTELRFNLAKQGGP